MSENHISASPEGAESRRPERPTLRAGSAGRRPKRPSGTSGQRRSESISLLIGSVVGALLTLVGLQALHAWAAADNDPATDALTRVIPYTGRLEKDGVAVNGTAELRFRLYTRGAAAAAYVWSATYAGTSAVKVVNGRFQVLLGDNAPLTDAVNDAEELYLGVEVQRNGAWESLGKQPVAPTTYALWTPRSANLRVGGGLTVGGAATLTGGLALTGDATLAKAKASLELGGRPGAAKQTGTHAVVFPGAQANAGLALRYATATNVVSVERRSDGAALFSVDADNGNLDVAGPVTLGASSSANGDVTLREGRDVVVPGSGTVTLGRKSTTRTGVTLGSDASGSGFELLWTPNYEFGELRTGNDVNAGTSAMLFVASNHMVSVGKDVTVEGDLVLGVTEASGFSTLESDCERFFKADSSCPIGSLRAAVVESASAICMCRASGSDHGGGRGWYCIQ